MILFVIAPVAQWIEQWPPEPCAEVRFLSGAFFMPIIPIFTDFGGYYFYELSYFL